MAIFSVSAPVQFRYNLITRLLSSRCYIQLLWCVHGCPRLRLSGYIKDRGRNTVVQPALDPRTAIFILPSPPGRELSRFWETIIVDGPSYVTLTFEDTKERDQTILVVIKAPEFKSEDPGFYLLAGQGDGQFFLYPVRVLRLVCAWPSPPFPCSCVRHVCAYVKDPISIYRNRAGLTAGGIITQLCRRRLFSGKRPKFSMGQSIINKSKIPKAKHWTLTSVLLTTMAEDTSLVVWKCRYSQPPIHITVSVTIKSVILSAVCDICPTFGLRGQYQCVWKVDNVHEYATI